MGILTKCVQILQGEPFGGKLPVPPDAKIAQNRQIFLKCPQIIQNPNENSKNVACTFWPTIRPNSKMCQAKPKIGISGFGQDERHLCKHDTPPFLWLSLHIKNKNQMTAPNFSKWQKLKVCLPIGFGYDFLSSTLVTKLIPAYNIPSSK
jgi:hypothetical protein